ncbi:FCD domain-containing protein [Gordonia humi]|uniref:DNA-binding FadR family transcriptional regulator n=1 Tax=Gordonia humi TaxID=686429 RepID=A0A840EQ94_9ACTN|nr:DNA-binding FadR family transcriptional regulator [Gordonia humi]
MAESDSADRRPAYAVVADGLRDRILAGDLKPGTRLPVDADLRAEFGVGQSTVREAIRTLASENLVRTVRGATGGTFVAEPSFGHITAHVEAGVTLLASAEAVTVDQLMEVRQLTEVPAAGAAAFRRTDEQLAELRATMYEPTTEVSEEMHLAHQEFHRIVLHAAGNPLLDLVTVPVFKVLSSRFSRDMAPRGVWPGVDADHIGIYDAIAARDSITAMNLMRRHLDQLGDIYKQMDLLRRPS